MSGTVAETLEQSDAQLITAVRAGDNEPYGTLFERHRGAALRLARQLLPGAEAEDLVSEAFTRVFVQLQDGKGPDLAFRAYLLTAVRRLHVDRIRASQRVRTTDSESELDRHVEFFDMASINFERGTAADAFSSLPERWQLVLWHLDVEGQKPSDVAPLLGMSANSVSALAYRAREGLRQAYLQHHLADTASGDCRWTTERLGAHVRKGLSAREAGKVEEHLDGCRRCMGIYLELIEVNSNLSGILVPALLGTAAAGYLAGGTAAGGAAAVGGAVGLKGFLLKTLVAPVKGFVAGQPAGAAAVAVAAIAATTLIAVAAINGSSTTTTDRKPAAIAPAVPTPSAAPAPTVAPETTAPTTPSTLPSPVATIAAAEPEAFEPPATEPAEPTQPAQPTEPTEPPPPPVIHPDLALGPITVDAGDIPILERRVTIPVTGDLSDTPVDLRVTIDFSGIVVLSRTFGDAWRCSGPALGHSATCTRTQTGPAVPPLVFGVVAVAFSGTATVTSSPAEDPDTSNNSAAFRFGLLS